MKPEKKLMDRRTFLKIAGISAANISLSNTLTYADHDPDNPLEKRAKKKAVQFVNTISNRPIKNIQF